MKFIFWVVCILTLGQLKSQSAILLEQDTVYGYFIDEDISGDVDYFALSLVFGNNTNESLDIRWEREFSENCPEEWLVTTFDPRITYFPDINQAHFLMAPSATDLQITLDFYPQTVPGCCDVKMIFALNEDPGNPIDTGYYHIEINDEGCLLTSLYEKVTNELLLYPNPVSGDLFIDNIHFIESLEIIDLTGKRFALIEFPSSRQIDVSSLPCGVYICRIRHRNLGVIVNKIVKQ